MGKTTYKDSGVDLDVYQEAMGRLPKWLRRTHSPRVVPAAGGFAGLFQLDFAGSLFSRKYDDPLLVSATDGVGTKTQVARRANRHQTVGIDLVAMCVNDAICCGAEPLFFLDYVALAEDDPQLLEDIVRGISDGCLASDMALVGGETAIMPDVYRAGDYDLAGFCVGVVDRSRVIDGKKISSNDVVLGLASSGVHSNGFSLIRKLVFELSGLDVDSWVPDCDATVGDVLLTPTTLYVRAVRRLLRSEDVSAAVHGIAHITGGGLCENLARVLPQNVNAVIDEGSWPVPPVFSWIQQLGDVDDAEMQRVFNMGVGLALVVAAEQAHDIQAMLSDEGQESWLIGKITAGDGQAVRGSEK